MTEMDPGKIEEQFGRLFGKMEGAMTCALGYIGDRLGLYRELAGGELTSADLARKTGLKERWVREWLRQQTAAGLVDHAGDRFSLSPEAAAVLGQENSPFFGAGAFDAVVGLFTTVKDSEDSFRTGIGAPYDAFGPVVTKGVERMLAPFYRHRLVPEVLPSLDGVVDRLREGAKVADIGCGAGIALIEMARAFPESEFHGYDNSRLALGRATTNREEAGVENVVFHDTTHGRLPEDQSFDLVTTLDCIHDMTHPVETIGAIRRSLKTDGTWFAADIRGYPSFQENLESQPFAGMLYGFSVICCMRSALSTPDGAGLGTLGFPEAEARRIAGEAGFTRFTKHDFDNPLNDYYEIRP